MPLKVLAQLKALPQAQRVALGVGAAGATGLGLYSLHKRTAGGAKPAAAAPGGPQSTLAPSGPSDLSQYAVLVPMNWQDGANFGGAGGLTGPLTPGAPVTTPPPETPSTPAPPVVVAPPALPASNPSGGPAPGSAPYIGAGGSIITPTTTTFTSFPTVEPLPTAPVSVYQSGLGHNITLDPNGGTLGERVWAALLANSNTPISIRQQATNFYTPQSV